jgi:hypothetical protein
MARYRTIKPVHWNDKELPNISLQAHLLWIATWNFSDDEGIFEADVNLIRSQVFPRRTDIRAEQIEQWIGQLVKARFVIPFTYNGGGYYISRTFKTHQKIEKPQKSKVPKDVIDNILNDQSPPIPLPIADQSPTNRQPVSPREESSVKESKGEESSPAPPDENLCYDIEKYLLGRQKDFESVCMNAKKWSDFVKDILKKFHLWQVANDKYPKKPLQLIAGLQSWILNEKNYSKNGHSTTATVGKEFEPD